MSEHEHSSGSSAVVARAEAGDHGDFYLLGAALEPSLHALEDLAVVLRRQVYGYGRGRELYDDSGEVNPAVRLAEAAEHLAHVRGALDDAHRQANAFWSAIGDIGLGEAP
jgi:hypothetical protein